MGKRKSTSEKLKHLIESDTLEQALEGAQDNINLPAHLRTLVSGAKLNTTELARRLMSSRIFVYQVLEGLRSPGRDMLLKMAFVFGLTVDETQRLLTVGGRGALYPRVRRDAILIYALEKRYSLEEADAALGHQGEQPLLSAL